MTGAAKPNHFDAPIVPSRADRRQKGGDPVGPVAIVTTAGLVCPSEFFQCGPAHAAILHQGADRLWIAQNDSCWRGRDSQPSAYAAVANQIAVARERLITERRAA